ncbi:MAG: GIY-YIG nuclease family protein [Patescibacteria group bacterium]
MLQEWYYVYILYSLKDKKLYVGYTKNLRNRISAHNNGLNTSTKCRRPLVLISASAFINETDAKNRELFYKSGRGREIVKQELEYTFKALKKL